jgi:prolyl-tRNA synthetase
MKAMYRRIFDRLGLDVAEVDANVGVMGGSESMEFVAPGQNGDDELLHCTDCCFGVTDEHGQYDEFDVGASCPDCAGALRHDNGIEVGHIFALGTRYSSKMDFSVDSSDGDRAPVYMASYGIGITRTIQTLIEQNGDERSCAWGLDNGFTCSPFDLSIIRGNGIADDLLSQVRTQLSGSGRRCLEYTGDRSIGEQFSESDLIGIPVKIILGNHLKSEGEVEIELHDGERMYVEPASLRNTIADVF